LFFRQSEKLIGQPVGSRMRSAEELHYNRVIQRKKESPNLTNLSRLLQELVRFCERGVGIAKEP
jgi:hypothetical protein